MTAGYTFSVRRHVCMPDLCAWKRELRTWGAQREAEGRKVTFSLSVKHGEINGLGEATVSPGQWIGSFLEEVEHELGLPVGVSGKQWAFPASLG